MNRGGTATSPSEALEKWRGRRVLVVDDSSSSRYAAVQLLESLGFSLIHEVENGRDALEALKDAEHRFDLLLTDLNMPDMDGIELLTCLAKSPVKQALFVAVMSGVHRDVLDTVQGIAEASLLELLAVLPKPLMAEDLRQMLAQCDPDKHMAGVEGLSLEVCEPDIALALDAGQLQPYFQPKVSLVDHKLKGFEALVRWIHPVHGVVPPLLFVQYLESGELAERFFFNFVEQVAAVMAGLHGGLSGQDVLDFEHVHCSVNLPVPLLETPALVERLEAVMRHHHLPNSALVVELTETTLMSHLGSTLGTLARLRMKGFGVAMDDYGTGYSSMKQLSRCPFSELKIDREFVHDASSSPKRLAILTGAIAMCQRLKMVCVAEGVEVQSDWDQLAALGCELAQGYFISRPMPASELLAWVLAP
ncbi:EAL domain-containing response regulator [Roseateles koreensis]|uniref:EAL domain-containing protein n=1 Tax=Roseateles koreensis TaxID=2987526 RepID=A0ABT5KRP1_9BURK|nr:EAL domain-containing protein [Roseateles koreensis]MDC8785576.1 EAL domain-containing protein [Roseateles koreensis]